MKKMAKACLCFLLLIIFMGAACFLDYKLFCRLHPFEAGFGWDFVRFEDYEKNGDEYWYEIDSSFVKNETLKLERTLSEDEAGREYALTFLLFEMNGEKKYLYEVKALAPAYADSQMTFEQKMEIGEQFKKDCYKKYRFGISPEEVEYVKSEHHRERERADCPHPGGGSGRSDKEFVDWAKSPEEFGIEISDNGISMTAMADQEEAYPGIYVDGQDKDEELLYLGAFELPNESFPCRITGRLYAGYASFETDGPIAMVTHDVMDREKKKQREKKS